MRPGQQKNRGRGRGNNNNNGGGGNNNNNFNRKGGNPLSRSYDSSGPDIKIRGTAQHIAEKYAQLGRDAQSSGDRVMAENYLQHAEHYNRIIAAAQAQMQDRFQHQDRDGNGSDQDDLDNNEDDNGFSQQPAMDEAPQPVVQQQQPRRDQREQRESREQRDGQAPAAIQPATEAASISAPVVDGSGPQPVIEGTPVEVAVEEETQAEATPRRRSPGRPRRQPLESAEGSEDGKPASDDGKPALAEAGE